MLQGVHYTEKGRAEAGHIRPQQGLTSSTALHELAQLEEDLGCLDYAFLSPIFDSISKAGYHAAFQDSEKLKAAVAASPVPLFALGGESLAWMLGVNGKQIPVQDAASGATG